MNQFDWISFWADITPDKTAAIEESTGASLDYSTLNYVGNQVSSYLQHILGFEKNDRIIIIAPNCFEYLYFFAAAQKIGICIVPLNYRLTKNELSKLIEESEARLVLYHQNYADLVVDFNYAFKLTDFFSKLEQKVRLLEFDQVDLVEDDPVFILFTSGSSGLPKGVKYTHKMMYWNSINTQISLIINNETTTVICLPPFHTGAWNVLMTPILHVGGTVILMDKFEPNRVLELIASHKCQIFMGVPTMLQMMREEETFENADLSSLKYMIVGGEAMSLSLIEDYHDKGVPIRQGYGMTEVGPNITSLHEKYAIDKIGSIGKPNMYVDIKIVNDSGVESEVGESGELWLNGPVVTPGYCNNPPDNEGAFDADGWFKTGDIVRMDNEGFLYIVDRKKNMYISGGENVYPAEVEGLLCSHSEIRDVVIIGVPDNRWGEVGFAFVLTDTLTEADVRRFCIDNISKYKFPKYIKIVDSLPKTDTGKMDRKLLNNIAHDSIKSEVE